MTGHNHWVSMASEMKRTRGGGDTPERWRQRGAGKESITAGQEVVYSCGLTGTRGERASGGGKTATVWSVAWSGLHYGPAGEGVSFGSGRRGGRKTVTEERAQEKVAEQPCTSSSLLPLGMLSSATAWKLSGARQRANDVFIR